MHLRLCLNVRLCICVVVHRSSKTAGTSPGATACTAGTSPTNECVTSTSPAATACAAGTSPAANERAAGTSPAATACAGGTSPAANEGVAHTHHSLAPCQDESAMYATTFSFKHAASSSRVELATPTTDESKGAVRVATSTCRRV
ncbi:hypothetical protein D1007_59761 [Hordeum vulgare]|nr:hypothetical protein D1007_59761 [Hordeum vulgare]